MKFMKTSYIKIVTLVIALASLASCSDWLTVQPEGKIVSTNYWKSKTDVDAVLASCYLRMIQEDYMSRIIVWGELRSDNFNIGYGVGGDEKKIWEVNILPENRYTQWSSFYSVINYCNLLLEEAPKVIDPNFSTAELNAKMAEAITLRALSYFYLVRTFRDVPLILLASSTDQIDYATTQSSEDVVLDQLESDLIKAEDWATVDYGTVKYNRGRITKNAVRALLADIYLWRNKYAECISSCDRVTSDSKLKLTPAEMRPYLNIFGRGNSKEESIFELQFDITSKVNTMVYSFYGADGKNNSGQFSVPNFITVDNTVFVNTPEIIDVRRKDFITPKDQSNVYHMFKYVGNERTENSDGTVSFYNYKRSSSETPNWIVYRLSDVMLMKAEALVQLDNFKDALKIVNNVYLRSNPNPALSDSLRIESYNTKDQMEQLVLLERQRELMFEGKRWFDLLRVARRDGGKTDKLVEKVVRKYTDNVGVVRSKLKSMNSMYMPVNAEELKANPKLKQNEFYLLNSK